MKEGTSLEILKITFEKIIGKFYEFKLLSENFKNI